MGQKQGKEGGNGGGAAGQTAAVGGPRTAKQKLAAHAKHAGGMARHHQRKDVNHEDLARDWAAARFDVKTHLVRVGLDGKGGPVMVSDADFAGDPLVQKMFMYMAHQQVIAEKQRNFQETGANARATTHELTRKQFCDGIAQLAALTEQDMAEWIIDAMLFTYNGRTNRLHPTSIDAASIRKTLVDAGTGDSLPARELQEFFQAATGDKGGALSKKQCVSMLGKEVGRLIDPKKLTRPPHLHPAPLDPGAEFYETDSDSESGEDEDEALIGGDGDGDEAKRKGQQAAAPEKQASMFIYTVTFGKGPLGMTLATKPGVAGCVVGRVVNDSQAAKATVLPGHSVIKVAGQPCRDSRQAMDLLKTKPRPVAVVFGKPTGEGASRGEGVGGGAGAKSAGAKSAGARSVTSPSAGAKSDGPTPAAPGGGGQKNLDKATVNKKVVVMRKLRDKKLELVNCDDPAQQAKLKQEIGGLMKRLRAIDKAAGVSSGGAGATSAQKMAAKPAPKPQVVGNEAGETYTFVAQAGPIGIGLKPSPDGEGLTVDSIKPGTQAENSDELAVGDKLVRVGADIVRHWKRAKILKLIATAPRPLQLQFELGDEDSSSDDE